MGKNSGFGFCRGYERHSETIIMSSDLCETDAFAVSSKDFKEFEKIKIKRNAVGADDVQLDVKYCGICHSDVHFTRAEIAAVAACYPMVPGHEIAGIATKVGKNVKGIKVGDHVGVGCFVDSCMECQPCKAGYENGCDKFPTLTFNGKTVFGRISTDRDYTYGGYSKSMTVNSHFVIRIPKGYPLEKAGPVFCSGITVYTPLKEFGAIKGGKKVGVIGIGGLGQMAVNLAAAMGNEVTAISTSPKKKETAMSIGAKHFLVSTDADAMAKAVKSLDLIINTVSANHQISTYLPLLAFKFSA
jgi:uncharacterized zinc-type alcohol dehydrogenase-like protein